MKSQASEQVLLKVSPMKGIMRFNNKGKFIPCYIGLFEIPDRVELMAYKLTYHLACMESILCLC